MKIYDIILSLYFVTSVASYASSHQLIYHPRFSSISPTNKRQPHFSDFKSLIHILHPPHNFNAFRIPCLGEVDVMSRPGDWNCRSCNHLNFQWRDSCQKCGDPRQGGGGVGDYTAIFGGGRTAGGSAFGFTTGPDVRPGDWYCNVRNCGAHNFASRSSCFKCGALKDELPGGGFEREFGRGRGFGGSGGSSGGGGGRSGWKSGDWICSRPGCNEHNFASRMECFRCNAPRDVAGRSSFIS